MSELEEVRAATSRLYLATNMGEYAVRERALRAAVDRYLAAVPAAEAPDPAATAGGRGAATALADLDPFNEQDQPAPDLDADGKPVRRRDDWVIFNSVI